MTIDGSSVQLSHTQVVCSHSEGSDFDTHLSWVLSPPPGMLKRMLSVGYPKGVRGSTVYVARINMMGDWRMAKPCDRCLRQLKARGVRYVVHTTDDGGWMKGRL